MGKELFKVVSEHHVTDFGQVELVCGDIDDVVIDVSADNFKASCCRCCFYKEAYRGCERPGYLPTCINYKYGCYCFFYKRKTAENIKERREL